MDRAPYDATLLHPVMSGPATSLVIDLRARPFKTAKGNLVLAPFEGFRHPARQAHLFTTTKATKARPWQSAHQYGLAVDFAGLWMDEANNIIPGSWEWNEVPASAWVDLKRRAAIVGLDVPIKWDMGHVQHPLFQKVKAFLL